MKKTVIICDKCGKEVTTYKVFDLMGERDLCPNCELEWVKFKRAKISEFFAKGEEIPTKEEKAPEKANLNVTAPKIQAKSEAQRRRTVGEDVIESIAELKAEGMATNKIAQTLKLPYSTVNHYVGTDAVNRSACARKTQKLDITKDELYKAFVEDGKNIKEVAEAFGITFDDARSLIVRYDLFKDKGKAAREQRYLDLKEEARASYEMRHQ